jgi:hypothetical protein
LISFVLDPPALVALANAAVFDRGVAPTWPPIAAGQDPLSDASLRLSTTELSFVNHPQALEWTHARSVDLVGGPIAKHGSPIAAELGDMGR